MANREEHLKKINAELEQLSDDDLEKIAGGSCGETADDSRFLNVLLKGTNYYQCDRYGATRIWFDYDAKDDVEAAWNGLGIKVELNRYLDNTYYMNGRVITQAEAWAHAEDLVGRQLTRSQWDW